MAVKKIAISLPEPVLEAVDRLAAERGMPRSRLIASILERVAARKHDDDISAAVDALFEDEELLAEQRRTAEQFRSIIHWPEAEW